MAFNAITVLDNLVREELPNTINESLPDIAPVYKYIQSSSLGVKRNDIGRQWKVLTLFSTGIAGLMQSAAPVGPTFETNTYFSQSQFIDSDATDGGLAPFPSAVNAPHTGSLKRELVLQLATGNFSLPVTWIQGDALSSSQIAQVARDVKAVGEMRALTEAQSFFMSSKNALCQIDNWAGSSAAGDGGSTGGDNGKAQFTVKSGTGRTQFFRIGMMIDIMYNNSGTPNWGTTGGTNHANDTSTGAPWGATYIPMVISDVDYISGTITIASVPDVDFATGSNGDIKGAVIADNDWIVLANCGTVSGREMRTWGLEDWIKSSGQIMGGSGGNAALDLDTYSQFKSKVAAINAPLTDAVMNGYIGGFLDAYPGSTIDTLITTMGVTLKYLEQPSLNNNRMVYDRQGKTLNVAGGWSEVTYSFNGKNLRWIISPMCLGGTLYGTKFNNGNITRYIPPRVGGSDGRVGGDIEFLAPLGGHTGIFKIAHDSSGNSQAILEAPFWQYCSVIPTDVRGVKLTGLTEATGIIE